MSSPAQSTPLDNLTLNFRFGVLFMAGGAIPNPIDIRFQRVSGLSAEIETTTVEEGGQNLYTHRLPKRVGYQNLVLERGMLVGSPLHIEFSAALSAFKFAPSNVLVTLFDEQTLPKAAWMFFKAFPQRWSIGDLDATGEGVVLIETLELAYTRMQPMAL